MKKTLAYPLCAALLIIGALSYGSMPVEPPFVEQKNIRAPLAITVHANGHYRHGKSIPVKLMITNVSEDPVLINKRMLVNHFKMDGELAFLIVGPDQKAYPLTKIISPLRLQPSDIGIMDKGETIEETIDLAEYYGLRHRGTYKVKAVYHNNYDMKKGKLKTWQGVVASEVTDVVIE